jgi:hypothetical protein
MYKKQLDKCNTFNVQELLVSVECKLCFCGVQKLDAMLVYVLWERVVLDAHSSCMLHIKCPIGTLIKINYLDTD